MSTDSARGSSIGTQRQYDNAYIQCMYTKEHRVPVPASLSSNVSIQRPVSAAEAGIPPPPPGNPPEPPPR